MAAPRRKVEFKGCGDGSKSVCQTLRPNPTKAHLLHCVQAHTRSTSVLATNSRTARLSPQMPSPFTTSESIHHIRVHSPHPSPFTNVDSCSQSPPLHLNRSFNTLLLCGNFRTFVSGIFAASAVGFRAQRHRGVRCVWSSWVCWVSLIVVLVEEYQSRRGWNRCRNGGPLEVNIDVIGRPEKGVLKLERRLRKYRQRRTGEAALCEQNEAAKSASRWGTLCATTAPARRRTPECSCLNSNSVNCSGDRKKIGFTTFCLKVPGAQEFYSAAQETRVFFRDFSSLKPMASLDVRASSVEA